MKETLFLFLMAVTWQGSAPAADIYVSPAGRDSNSGAKARPLASLAAAQRLARSWKSAGAVTVWLRGGTYYLPQTLVFSPEDSGTKKTPVTYAAFPGEEPVISGGIRLRLTWTPYRDGILIARVPAGLHSDQFFVNGKRQILARYPNYDPAAAYFNGWSPDAFSKERAARWRDPRGGYIHAMHRHMWGDFHYVITGKNADGNVTYEGGWQNNRRLGMHDKYRFVENIFEELDAPGEWYLDEKTATLYFYPPAGIDLKTATVEAVRLRHLIEFRGNEGRPVQWVQLRGLTLRHAARTFMDNREPLLRSDWTVYRGGAILLTGAEDCALEELFIDQVGGNAIFVNNHNRRIVIRRSHIADAGGNGVAFVGDPGAVRNPLFEYNERQSLKDIDLRPGPKTDNYPAECLLEDSLIERTGRVEKQTAPVEISMSQDITVRHCSIYDVPRAGINISEGTWGGHVIEFNDVFDTVKETGDHGSFNSWGRDRYWGLKDVDANTITAGANRELPRLDAVKPVILRSNRWRCDHGWDIDLDDGSTNYRIYNNLTLNGGIKLREGFFRTVENNVMGNNSFHPHVWFKGSEDVFRNNIVFGPYRPIRVAQPWGSECDYNVRHVPGMEGVKPATELQKQSGRDGHSVETDALFVNPAAGDYRVREGSPALQLGFQNFPMDQFGVEWPKLKRIARTPELPRLDAAQPATLQSGRDPRPSTWLGASVKNIVGMGEVSAWGLPGEAGVLVLDVPQASRAAAAGLRKGDVVLRLDGKPADTLRDLQRLSAESPAFGTVNITIWRGQREITLVAEAPVRVEMFNAPNHVELGRPATGRGSSNVLPQATFGTITATRASMVRFNSRSSIASEYFERKTMHLVIEKMLTDFERGGMTRRQLALSLAALVTRAQAAPKQESLRAVTLNHVTVRVPDVNRTSQFYQEFFGMSLKQHSEKTHILGVGKSFFGIEQKGTAAGLDHYDFGITGFDADKAIDKIKARNLKLEPGGTKESFKFWDPDGFLVQLNGPDYEGHVGS